MTLAAGVGETVLAGPLVLTLLLALAAGTLSFFSPCCLPLIPGYLSYVAGLLDKLPLAGFSRRPSFRPGTGLAGAPLLGALFAIGWTACIGPTLAAVLSLAADSASAGRGAVLSFTYSLGLGLPFLLAAASFDGVMRRFTWARRHARAVM